MQESSLILSEYEEINSLLLKPIATTQRIKYTCINVSTNHIAVGSTSGSIYLFTREPCIFQQLIPLSEGPVTHILISPDEKTIALSSKRGSVCLISIKPSVKLLSISNEHVGEIITCLHWNSKSSEIYVGDNNGKISTIVLSIFTVNGMFQAPSCALMHLDSSIVQMDYYLHYLLVSTLTRCYICDTAQEQFKQIGNKIRDGEFGGCFLKDFMEFDKKSSILDDDKMLSKNIGLNSIIGLNNDTIHEQKLKIYCARPGCRLWEVNTYGIVVKTHQFKDALSIAPTYTFKSSLIKSLNNTEKSDKILSSTHTLNFSRLIVISKKYLLSYTSNNLYIIDPLNTNIILWTDEFPNIFMVNVLEDKIYLMTISGTFHCLLLSSIESLILKLYDCKLYIDCVQACSKFSSQLMNVIKNNEIIINIDKIINKDWTNVENNDIIDVLQPIISTIQSNINTPQRLQSGIVVVNTGSAKLRTEDSRLLNLTNENFIDSKINIKYEENDISDSESSDSEIIYKNVKKKIKNMTINQTKKNHENGMNRICHSLSQVELRDFQIEKKSSEINNSKYEESQSKELEITMSAIQLKLEPLYVLIENLKLSTTIEEIEKIINTVMTTLNDINNEYENITQLKKFTYEIIRSFERNYFHALLENISIDLLSKNFNDYILNEVTKAFVDINSSNYLECTCGFPRVIEQCKEPKFIEIGKILFEIFIKIDRNKCISLCKNVPYMLHEYLMLYINDKKLLEDDIIPLCLQTKDNILLSFLFHSLNENHWKIIVECVKRMETGRCLNCNQSFGALHKSSVKNDLIDWSGVTHEIMKIGGTKAAMTFLDQLTESLPHIKLTQELYQSLIFTELADSYGLEHTVKVDENKLDNESGSICSPEAQEIILAALEKDLGRPVSKDLFGTGDYHWGIVFDPKTNNVCSSCTLSLQNPVLLGDNGIAIFPCGHAYHVNCMIQKKITKCFLHS